MVTSKELLTTVGKVLGILAVALSILVARASSVDAQKSFQIMGCSSGKVVTLSETETLRIYNMTGKGVASSTAGNRAFEDMLWDFAVILHVTGKDTRGMGYFKFTDRDGDYFILEAAGNAIIEGGAWQYLCGTGKWQGVAANLKGRFILHGKPLSEETEQYWCRAIGTLELPY